MPYGFVISELERLATHLESIGHTREAHTLDIVANSIDKMLPEVNALLKKDVDGTTGDDVGATSNTRDINKIVRDLGVTEDIRNAGYILPTGQMLDLSPRPGKPVHTRETLDWLVPLGAIEITYDPVEGTRVMIRRKPNKEQYPVLEHLFEKTRGLINMNAAHPRGLLAREYPQGTKPSAILNDLKRAYGDLT